MESGTDTAAHGAAMWLGRLRQEFPQWGFLHDPFRGRWLGVRGRMLVEAQTAQELWERLAAAIRRRA
jgi:hypothetical protein